MTALASDTRLQIVGINWILLTTPPLPRPLRQSVCRCRRRQQRPRLDRMGRLRRARDVCGRPRRHHCLQVGRAGDAGQSRQRAEGRDREGVEGGALNGHRKLREMKYVIAFGLAIMVVLASAAAYVYYGLTHRPDVSSFVALTAAPDINRDAPLRVTFLGVSTLRRQHRNPAGRVFHAAEFPAVVS